MQCLHTAKYLQQKRELEARGSVLRDSISLVVIGFILVGSARTATAQYLPPQPPPIGYSPPTSYSYESGPARYQDGHPYSGPYEDSYDRLLPATAAAHSLSTTNVLFL